MNQRKETPGRYALIPSAYSSSRGKTATFYDQDTFADSQSERALDLRNSGFPIAGLGVRERIQDYFFRTFRPFWTK